MEKRLFSFLRGEIVLPINSIHLNRISNPQCAIDFLPAIDKAFLIVPRLETDAPVLMGASREGTERRGFEPLKPPIKDSVAAFDFSS